MKDSNFENTLKKVPAWKSFKMAVTNFLGNTKAEDYEELVEQNTTTILCFGLISTVEGRQWTNQVHFNS